LVQVPVLSFRTTRRELQMEKTRAAMLQQKINNSRLERLEAEIERAAFTHNDSNKEKIRREQVKRYPDSALL
jgi:hypothetical protein